MGLSTISLVIKYLQHSLITPLSTATVIQMEIKISSLEI